MSGISVSAIIVTYNSADSIINCLASLLPQLKSVGGEVVVFDNNSTDSTVLSIRGNYPEVKIMTSPKNIGFAAACNAAAPSATGEYLLFVNPDLLLDNNAISMMLACFERRSDCGIVTARLRFPDGRFQANCRRFPTISNIFLSRGSLLQRYKLLKDDGAYTLPDYPEITRVPATSATCLMIRRSLFDELKGFDSRFFLFMEDTDLCQRALLVGKSTFFTPYAGAVHLWGSGSNIAAWRRDFYQHMSVWKYFLKYYPNGFSILALPLLLAINLVAKIILRGGSKKSRLLIV